VENPLRLKFHFSAIVVRTLTMTSTMREKLTRTKNRPNLLLRKNQMILKRHHRAVVVAAEIGTGEEDVLTTTELTSKNNDE
jgi:hypothetical protein